MKDISPAKNLPDWLGGSEIVDRGQKREEELKTKPDPDLGSSDAKASSEHLGIANSLADKKVVDGTGYYIFLNNSELLMFKTNIYIVEVIQKM